MNEQDFTMIKRQMLKETDAQVATRLQKPPKSNFWKQDESLPCHWRDQISPLTTVSIIKDFLNRLGMDNESWRLTNIKDLHLPSVQISNPRFDSANLRAISTPLTPFSERPTLSKIRDILASARETGSLTEEEGRVRSKNNVSNEEEKRTVMAPNGGAGRRSKKINTNNEPLFRSMSRNEASFRRASESDFLLRLKTEREGLFTLPRSRCKSYVPTEQRERKFSSLKRETRSKPKLYLAEGEKDIHDCSPVANIFDFPEERHFLESKRISTTSKNEGIGSQSKEFDRGKESGMQEGLASQLKAARKCNLMTGKCSSHGVRCTGDEKERHQSILLQIGKENNDEDGKQMVDFEKKVERFNEISPLICGFKSLYPSVRMSVKYLVNHLNHKRMVKKFYSVAESKRLNVNFTPENVLQSKDTVAKKQDRLNYKRIKWLAAATDALEVDKARLSAKSNDSSSRTSLDADQLLG